MPGRLPSPSRAGDLIGQATAIDGDTIETHSSTFGFGPSTHQSWRQDGEACRPIQSTSTAAAHEFVLRLVEVFG